MKGTISSLKITFIIAMGILAFFSESKAQEQTFTYKEAVTRALDENITLKIQVNEMDAVKMEKVQSRAQFAPSASAFMQFRRQSGNIFIPQQAELIQTTADDFFPQFSADLTLFNGMSNVNNLKRANHRFEAQHHNIKNTEQEIIALVTNQYMTVLLDQEYVKIAKENIEAQETLLNRIKGFVDAGITFVGDQYNQEAEIKSLELAEVQAINQLKNDKAVLARILLLDPLSDIKVVEPNWTLEDQMINEYTLESLYQTALANREDLKQLTSLEKANGYSVSMAKSNLMPRVAAFFNYDSYYNSSAQRDGEDLSFNEQVREINPSKAYGVTLNIPIFSRYQNRLNIAQSKVTHKNSMLEIDRLKNTIYTEVLTALQDYEAAIATYEASVAQFDAAELNMNTQKERYKLGNATIVDVTTATNNFISASVDKASARYTLLFQKIILDYRTGTLSYETLPGK
ncbi:TolC family protein [Flammeovirgaceae bacterium SG7u.111]|nr:TolC family protein [Flammeovirgaceae bacterium SG7u.132]WPO38242.1 TolC family protein [Flammeovirgaceae bacterium SG7u.111]